MLVKVIGSGARVEQLVRKWGVVRGVKLLWGVECVAGRGVG